MGTQRYAFKLLPLIAMIFISVSLTTFTIGYQVVQFGPYIFSAVALIIPFRYMLGDIVAEVYGYYTAKKFIYYMIFCDFIFALIVSYIIRLPAPDYWVHKDAYDFVLGKTLTICLDAAVGVLIGSMINIYLLSKWKLVLRGKHFWLRSLGSSIAGELTQYIIVLTMMYHTVFAGDKIVQLIFFDYMIQVFILIALSPVVNFIAFALKRYEGVDVCDHNIKLNPFVLSDEATP